MICWGLREHTMDPYCSSGHLSIGIWLNEKTTSTTHTSLTDYQGVLRIMVPTAGIPIQARILSCTGIVQSGQPTAVSTKQRIFLQHTWTQYKST